MKAVESSAAVNVHLEGYPQIDVMATDEVVETMHDSRVDASGFANIKLESDVVSRLDGLRDDTVATRTADAALLGLGIASTAELMQMLRGERRFPEAVMNTAAKVGTVAGATALTAMLFG